MIYTSSKLSILVLLLLLVGCQIVAEKEPAKVERDGSELAKTKFSSPNPYLLNRISIPADAQNKFEQANKALSTADWQQAERDLLWLTENHPQLSGPFLNLALLYSETQQFEKVDQYFSQAIAVNSQNVNAYNQYAIYCRQRGQFDQAEKLYLKALAVWPDYPEAHLNLAILYDLYMGKLTAALEHYQQYQLLLDEPDRQVEGWIMDTQRRVQQAEKE